MARPVVKREAIERAALELFVEKGISATTIRDIAERAATAEGTMYRHYRSKEALAESIYFEHLEHFMEDLRGQLADATSTRARLRALIGEFFALYDQDAVLYTYLVLAEHSVPWELPDAYETPPALLVRLLRQGQTAGEVRPGDANEQAALVMGTVVRLTVFRVHGRIDGLLSPRLEAVTDLVWRAIASDTNQG